MIIDLTKNELKASSGAVSLPVASLGGMAFPTTDGTAGHALVTNGTGTLTWGYSKLSLDTAPALGGDLTVGTHKLISSGDITLQPTGKLVVGLIKYPSTDGTNGQVLSTNGSGTLGWMTLPTISLVNDTAPKLGGDLDINGKKLVSTGNADITIQPAGMGKVILAGLKYPNVPGVSGQVLTTDGNNVLSWTTVGGLSSVQQDASPKLGGDLDTNGKKITSTGSTNIVIQPSGSGRIILGTIKFPASDGTPGQTLVTDGTGNLVWSSLSGGGSSQLMADLDVNSHEITSGTDVVLAPTGTTIVKSAMQITQGNFSALGDAKAGLYVLRGVTTSNSPTELFLDGSGRRLTLPNDSTWSFIVQIAARRADTDNESASYKIEGCIDNNATTVSLVGQPMTILMAEDNNAWDAYVEADNANKALSIKVVGENGKNVRWVAFVHTAEVIG